MSRSAVVLASLILSVTEVAAARPATPEAVNIRFSGEARARYETLSGQFRAGGKGGDQMLALRTLAKIEARKNDVSGVVEIQDSRSYLGDDGTPYSTSLINPADVLQAYVALDLPETPAFGKSRVQLGRMTLDIGSRRQVERVEFANVIFNYTGLYAHSQSDKGIQWHVLYVSPVTRRPADRQGLSDNDLSGDEEATNRRLWAVHHIRPKLMEPLITDVTGEAYVYGLDEKDAKDNPTPDRHYLTPGLRLSRAPKTGRWNFDVEAAIRHGTRRNTSLASDRTDLKVRAWTLHAQIGRTLNWPWTPNLTLDYDYASGDKTPNDNRYDQYERLFGSRRTDLGNTGIHGPLTPANIRAPGVRIEVKPNARTDARLAYKAAYLASTTDAWVVAQVRDSTGRSGDFIGHAIDGRVRYWLAPKRFQAEVGLSFLLGGDVGRKAPNAARQGDTAFGYAQITSYF